MKLLPQSPVAFREPIQKPPERLYLSGARGAKGILSIACTGEGIVAAAINVPLDRFAASMQRRWNVDAVLSGMPFGETLDDISNYLEGNPTTIRAIMQPLGISAFTLSVLRILARIPYGTTASYGAVASELGKPGAARAVGGACGRNPVPIIIPCHRVVASHGIGGFGQGIQTKHTLLSLEGAEGYNS